MEEKITADMLSAHGPVVRTLFAARFPEGLTRTELEGLAAGQGWLRRILAGLREGE